MARRRMHRTRSSGGADATGPDCRCAALCACDHCRAPRDRRPGCGRSLRPLRPGRDRHAAHATRAGQPPLRVSGGEVTPGRSPHCDAQWPAPSDLWPCARLGPRCVCEIRAVVEGLANWRPRLRRDTAQALWAHGPPLQHVPRCATSAVGGWAGGWCDPVNHLQPRVARDVPHRCARRRTAHSSRCRGCAPSVVTPTASATPSRASTTAPTARCAQSYCGAKRRLAFVAFRLRPLWFGRALASALADGMRARAQLRRSAEATQHLSMRTSV